MDKIGFRIGVNGSQWIITIDIYRPHFSPLDINCDYITSVEAISKDDEVIDPFLIIKGVSYLKK